jgi:hypothetical protein
MKTWVKALLIIGILGIAAAAVGYLYVNYKPHRNAENEEAAFRVSAMQLLNDYTTDETAANAGYLDKTGIVEGELSRVEDTGDQTIVVFALREGMFGEEGIRCTMLPDKAGQALELKPGGKIALKGICKGFNQVDVIFENCLIEK